MEEKELTGYPSIDKPWLKYYSAEAIYTPLPECTMYEYVWNNNKDHLNDMAIVYFGRKFTYKQFFEYVDQTAAAFAKVGVSKGDIVTIQSLSIPQVVFMIYALSKIGAVANLIYATANAAEVKANLAETGSRVLAVMEPMYSELKANISDTDLDAVVVMSIQDEMDLVSKMLYSVASKANKMKPDGKVVTWKHFYTAGKGEVSPNEGRNSDPTIMVYTGGTTGKSKGVMLSNYNLNVGALQYLSLGFERNKTFLCVLPPFIAFGLTVTIHMPLSFGLKTVLCIAADPTEIGTFVEKHKPNYIICGTAQAEKMITSLDAKKTDLSALEFLGVGGDALSISLEKKINTFLASHNSKTRIIQGYAMSETSASSTAAVHTIHKQGTVGIPFVYTNIKIVDTETNRELPYGKKGEICINAPCVMIGYYHNEIETNNIIKTHDDGKLWVHTGDIGYIDQDGFVTIVGRIKRMILTSENNSFHKVFPKILEDKFLKMLIDLTQHTTRYSDRPSQS